MVSSDRYACVIKLSINVVTDLVTLVGSSEGYKYCNIDGSSVLIQLVQEDGTTLGYPDVSEVGLKLGPDEISYLIYLVGYFEGYKYGKI